MRAVAAVWLVSTLLACAAGGPRPSDPPHVDPQDHYLRRVAVRDNARDYVLHWPVGAMPLRVHLPPPPDGLFEDPAAVEGAVRRAVLDWGDVASPGVPGFVFVDSRADADIPIAWAEQAVGEWYIAFCSVQPNPRQRRLDVQQILVTGRWGDGHEADLESIHRVLLHEMGHALGLLGHSDDPGDIMFPRLSEQTGAGLSERDRNTLRLLYARPSRQIRNWRRNR
jgi:hypothetical protein